MPAKKKATRKKPASKKTSAKKTSTKKASAKKASARKSSAGKVSAKKVAAAPASQEVKLLTLTEVARKVKISLPSAQRYKKLYQERIPSIGEGRKQRYPDEAVGVFRQIKAENLKRRGRPRKQPEASPEGLLTLTEISKRTGISYPTCVSYVKKNGDLIPHVGEGRKRRCPPEAVAVFQDLRGKSRRGRKPGTAKAGLGRKARGSKPAAAAEKTLLAAIKSLEKAQAENTRLFKAMVKLLERPLRITVDRR